MPIIGLECGAVKIMPYNPGWRQCFAKEKELLYVLLSKDAVDIQHIGSTAVPGLSAKPIIDIMVGIKALNAGLADIELLEGQGYEYRGEAGMPGRLFFVKGSPNSGLTMCIWLSTTVNSGSITCFSGIIWCSMLMRLRNMK